MSFNGEADIGMVDQKLGVGGKLLARVGTEFKAVVIEEDVLNVGGEQLLIRRSDGLHRSRRGYGDPRGGFLGPARTFGHEVVGGGGRGANALGAVGIDLADSINADVGGIFSAPAKLGGLARLDGIRVYRNGRRGLCRGWGRRRRWSSGGLFLAAGDQQESGQRDDKNAIPLT